MAFAPGPSPTENPFPCRTFMACVPGAHAHGQPPPPPPRRSPGRRPRVWEGRAVAHALEEGDQLKCRRRCIEPPFRGGIPHRTVADALGQWPPYARGLPSPKPEALGGAIGRRCTSGPPSPVPRGLRARQGKGVPPPPPPVTLWDNTNVRRRSPPSRPNPPPPPAPNSHIR